MRFQLPPRIQMDTLGFEPRAFRMRSGCDTTTPCALSACAAHCHRPLLASASRTPWRSWPQCAAHWSGATRAARVANCARATRNLPYTWPGSNWRPSACEADVIATRPQVQVRGLLDAMILRYHKQFFRINAADMRRNDFSDMCRSHIKTKAEQDRRRHKEDIFHHAFPSSAMLKLLHAAWAIQ